MRQKLTDEMRMEFQIICMRLAFFHQKYNVGTTYEDSLRFEGQRSRIPTFHPDHDELESYKVKLENFYSDTDLKEELHRIINTVSLFVV